MTKKKSKWDLKKEREQEWNDNVEKGNTITLSMKSGTEVTITATKIILEPHFNNEMFVGYIEGKPTLFRWDTINEYKFNEG